jgi:hypothetical protein
MVGMRSGRVALTVRLRLPAQMLAERLPVPPAAIGQELADQVDAYVRRAGLAHFPALEYFASVDRGIADELLDTVDAVAALVDELVRGELLRRLRGTFTDVHIDDVRMQAYALPGMRPGRANALRHLAQHFTPDTVRVDLRLTTIEQRADSVGMVKLTEFWLGRCLQRHFDSVEVTASRLLQATPA